MVQLLLLVVSFLPAVFGTRYAPYQSHKRQDILDGLVKGSLGAIAGALGVNATYDYVVVGGGTAGVAIATRLAQSNLNVALIEAGEFYELGDPAFASTPGGDVLFVGSDPSNSDPLVDWEFVARDQPGTNNRPIHYARGKCLGGSSALNFMVYQRATRESMQQWADLVDDQSYTYDNVLPFYKKSPDFTPPNTATRGNATASFNAGAFDASGGPLQVSYANYGQSFSTWMALGMHDIGVKETEDFNSGSLMGSQYCASTIRPADQTRSSSEASFLQSVLDSSTLKVYTGTLAKRILFDSNKTATGVEVSSAGITYTISANKEVIVSAGAFQSPQLLMVSGIGSTDTLTPLGIDVISDLPGVGQNMWDHPTVGPTYRVELNTFTKLARDPLYLTEKLVEYGLTHTGPLTNPVCDYLGWEKIPESLRSDFSAQTRAELAQFPEDWPEVEYISGAGYVGDFSNLLLNQPSDGHQYATILTVVISPTSRGNISLTSADTNDLPIINPNWLATETDQQVAVAAFKRARQAFNSSAMAPVVIGEEYYPGPNVSTDAQILEAVKDNMITLWHAACTCKMGNSSDPMAVVDNEARVFGVRGLRVVDASAFPILVPGHPQSTIYMLAEKIASNIIGNATSGA